MTAHRPPATVEHMQRWLRLGASVALIGAIFFFALPRFASFSEVWSAIAEMTWLELATLALIAAWNIVTYWFVMMSALPGSNLWQTMKVNQASTAVANTLPGGGALGVGVTYGMYTAYGFSRPQIGLAVLVSGIWNTFVKLGMPVIALALLALEGGAGRALVATAMAGVAALLASVTLFAAVLSSDRAARRVGRGLAWATSATRRLLRRKGASDLAEATVRFRSQAAELLSSRWLRLSVFSLLSHLSLYAVLLLSLRHVGVGQDQVSWVQVLAAFAFIRLISALPVTPGGLGVVELGLTAALVAAGGPEAPVVAAVLLYRALTYLPPIPIGLALYLRWRRGSEARKARLHAATPDPEVTA